jgi:hypothetical protein
MSIPIRAVVGLALALDIELVFGIVDRSEARAFMLETAHETCCSQSAAFVPVLNITGTKEKPRLSVAQDEALGLLIDRPGRAEAAGRH